MNDHESEQLMIPEPETSKPSLVYVLTFSMSVFSCSGLNLIFPESSVSYKVFQIEPGKVAF